MKYRVVVTLEAGSAAEAAQILANPERMPAGSEMRIVDVDLRRNLKWGAFLGLIIAFWVAAGTGLVKLWESLPR